MVCDCLVELAHVFLEKTFTYKVPNKFKNKMTVGMRVEVPFGAQILEGFVVKIRYTDDTKSLKEIVSLVDEYPVLNDELLSLGVFVKNSTLSSLMSSYQAMLPKALKAKQKVTMNVKKEKYISLNKDIDLNSYKFNETQTKIVNILKSSSSELKDHLNLISRSSVNTLIKKGILLETEKEKYRYNLETKNKKDFVLNGEQLNCFNKVKEFLGQNKTFLLYGVTGSGKTNIYMKLIEQVINSGKTALFLVPEISLTPQIIDRFTSYFSKIAVLHSRLSDSEKYDEWRKINRGEVNIVVGARSAIFAPLNNIGIIIIDEEHSSSYKQENNPKYDAISVAKWRCNYHKCPLVLGSATPTMESYTRALNGQYNLLTLKNRYNGMDPEIEIIDMNEEFKKNNSYLSNKLIDEIKNNIDKRKQVILFLNKRGFATTTMCKNCGDAIKCPNCDITLTYHKSSNMLRCHYCGYATKREKFCSNCHEEFKEYGIGTEKVEAEIQRLIPEVKIVRMDIDTTTKKNAHQKIINDFEQKKYDILLGTQMIAKGLDFPNVTLVGVINADISLNFPDFRSSEITFQLLNQVAGRSGRGNSKGKVLIQTFNKDHYAIECIKNNNYVEFYNKEIKIRKKLGYPPFYNICSLRVVSKDYDLASKMSIKITDYLKSYIKDEIVLGPSTANIFRLRGEYRFNIIIKYKSISNLRPILVKLNNRFFNDKKVHLDIDFNPLKM